MQPRHCAQCITRQTDAGTATAGINAGTAATAATERGQPDPSPQTTLADPAPARQGGDSFGRDAAPIPPPRSTRRAAPTYPEAAYLDGYLAGYADARRSWGTVLVMIVCAFVVGAAYAAALYETAGL